MLKFKSLPILVFAAIMVAVSLAMPQARADVLTANLTTDLCSPACAPGGTNFGSVTISSISSTEVSVELTLNDSEVFATSGAGHALNFEITGNPTINVSGLTSGFTASQTASGGNIHSDGSGYWEYSIDCTSCGSGTSPPNYSGPIDFDVTVAGGITPESFIQSSSTDPTKHAYTASGYYFATDIGYPCSGSGCPSSGYNTGVVAATSLTPVPAPPIGRGLPVLLAAGGMLFGAKLWERSRKQRSLRGAIANAAA